MFLLFSGGFCFGSLIGPGLGFFWLVWVAFCPFFGHGRQNGDRKCGINGLPGRKLHCCLIYCLNYDRLHLFYFCFILNLRCSSLRFPTWLSGI
uniref:Putative secreted peptide n=1 Tax=Anopheles braziliensis TaxID=58242 RepID=A0A2M3ZMM1_9DIPT